MNRLSDIIFWALWLATSFVLYAGALLVMGDWMRDGRSCARGTTCWYDSLEQDSPAGYRFGLSHAAELAVAIVCAFAGAIGAIALYDRATAHRHPPS